MAGITSFGVMADVLASEGIIDYDATAYVKGTKPRYIGKPATYANSGSAYPMTGGVGIYSNPYQRQLMNCYSGGGKDAFLKSASEMYPKRSVAANLDPKKVGLAAVLVGTVGYIASKCSKKCTAVTTEAKGKFANIFNKIKGNKAVVKVVDATESATKKFKIPTKFKILGVIAATLFGTYKVATNQRNNQQMTGSINSVPKY